MLEMLIVVAITLMLSAMAMVSFAYFRTTQALDIGTKNIASFVEKARHQTLEGLNGSQFGIHFGSGSAVLFSGTTYVSDDSDNEILSYPGGLRAAQISLAGGGPDVIFEQLTGDTAQSGTIVMQIGSAENPRKTITISSAGIVTVN